MTEFGEHDYAVVSVESICSRHKISKGMMYHYYSGKDELFLLCVKEVFRNLSEHIKHNHFIQTDQEGTEFVRYLFQIRESFFLTHPQQRNIFENALLRTPKHLAEKIAVLRQPLRELNLELFHQAVSQMRLRSPLCPENASQYLEGIEYVFWTLVKQYQGPDQTVSLLSLEEASKQVLDMLLFGIIKQN